MNYKKKHTGAMRVREPVQVYLDPEDQDRLERLTDRLGTSKSDALRRGLEALERQVTDPLEHPALRIVGIAGAGGLGAAESSDPARDHDQVLADGEEKSWTIDAG